MTQPYELIPTNPCPFCGGKSKITCVRRGNYSRKGDNYQGLCNKCKARGPLVQDDPQLAADKWNALGIAKDTPNGLELATIILSKLKKHTFKVTPHLSVDDPAGLEGLKLYEQSLVLAFEMGAKK